MLYRGRAACILYLSMGKGDKFKNLNEMSDIKNTQEIQRIIWYYFKWQYYTKLETLNEMENFLDTYHLPKLNKTHVNYFKSYTTSTHIEVDVKILLSKK